MWSGPPSLGVVAPHSWVARLDLVPEQSARSGHLMLVCHPYDYAKSLLGEVRPPCWVSRVEAMPAAHGKWRLCRARGHIVTVHDRQRRAAATGLPTKDLWRWLLAMVVLVAVLRPERALAAISSLLPRHLTRDVRQPECIDACMRGCVCYARARATRIAWLDVLAENVD